MWLQLLWLLLHVCVCVVEVCWHVAHDTCTQQLESLLLLLLQLLLLPPLLLLLLIL